MKIKKESQLKISILYVANIFFNFIVSLVVAKFLGPEEFGKFSLIASISMVLYLVFFAWLQNILGRFYISSIRLGDKTLRATTDSIFVVNTIILFSIFFIIYIFSIPVLYEYIYIALSLISSIFIGFGELASCSFKVKYDDATYLRSLLVKNIVSIFSILLASYLLPNYITPTIGLCVAYAFMILSIFPKLRKDYVPLQFATFEKTKLCMNYAGPIIFGGIFSLLTPLMNFTFIEFFFPPHVLGSYSLAYTLGTRIILVFDWVLNLTFFQSLVYIDEYEGIEAAHQHMSYTALMLAIILIPVSLGFWLVLPSFEVLLIPQSFQESIQAYLSILIPGVFFGMLTKGSLSLSALIAKRPVLLAMSSLSCFLLNAGLLWYLSLDETLSPFTVCMVQSLCYAALGPFMFLYTYLYKLKIPLPPLMPVLQVLLAAGLMFALVFPLRFLPPGIGTILLQIGLGVLSYSSVIAYFNTGNLRSLFLTYYQDRGPTKDASH